MSVNVEPPKVDPPVEPSIDPPAPDDDRQARAHAIIRHSTKVSAYVGLIPLPLLDMVGLLGVQLAMLRDLAQLYGIEFDTQRAKSLIGSLSGSVGGATIGRSIAMSLLRGIAAPLALIAGPSAAATFTWALGTAFNRHFQAGGQLHTFDNAAAAVRAEYKRASSAVGELLGMKS